jgi:hypothetical protein
MSTPAVVIDLAPIISQVLVPLITAGALSVMGWAAGVIGAHFHVQISATQRQLVEGAISNGIAYAQTKLGPKETIPANALAAEVAAYVLPKIPGALAWLKVTPEALSQLIVARLPQ